MKKGRPVWDGFFCDFGKFYQQLIVKNSNYNQGILTRIIAFNILKVQHLPGLGLSYQNQQSLGGDPRSYKQ